MFSEYRFSTGEAGARLFQMAIKFTKRGPIIWDHIDLDERNQPILFKRQVKSLRRRVWGYTWYLQMRMSRFVAGAHVRGKVALRLARLRSQRTVPTTSGTAMAASRRMLAERVQGLSFSLVIQADMLKNGAAEPRNLRKCRCV